MAGVPDKRRYQESNPGPHCQQPPLDPLPRICHACKYKNVEFNDFFKVGRVVAKQLESEGKDWPEPEVPIKVN